MGDPFGIADVVSDCFAMSRARLMQDYSVSLMRKSMSMEELVAQELLEMMPDQGGMAAAMRPQPGDIPAVSMGQYIDVYA